MPEVISKGAEAIAQQPSAWQIVKPFVIVGGILIVIAVLILILTIWIIKKIKLSQDIFHRLHRERKRLCKVHADRKRYIKWWRFTHNDIIKAVYTNSNNLHTKRIGHYMGHYYGSEGNLIVAFANRRTWGILWAKTELLVINKNPYIHFETNKEITDSKGMKKVVKEEIKQTLPTNIEYFTDEGLFLNAYGIDIDERTGFYHPVLKNEKGEVINLALPTYQSLRDVILQSYLYEQTNQFVKVAKKSIDLNPNIRGIQKVSDSSQSIETKNENY